MPKHIVKSVVKDTDVGRANEGVAIIHNHELAMYIHLLEEENKLVVKKK